MSDAWDYNDWESDEPDAPTERADELSLVGKYFPQAESAEPSYRIGDESQLARDAVAQHEDARVDEQVYQRYEQNVNEQLADTDTEVEAENFDDDGNFVGEQQPDLPFDQWTPEQQQEWSLGVAREAVARMAAGEALQPDPQEVAAQQLEQTLNERLTTLGETIAHTQAMQAERIANAERREAEQEQRVLDDAQATAYQLIGEARERVGLSPENPRSEVTDEAIMERANLAVEYVQAELRRMGIPDEQIPDPEIAHHAIAWAAQFEKDRAVGMRALRRA